MYHNYEELINDIRKKTDRKRIAIAAAHDTEVLECADSKRLGLADFILIEIKKRSKKSCIPA